jgi:hypothetical protein
MGRQAWGILAMIESSSSVENGFSRTPATSCSRSVRTASQGGIEQMRQRVSGHQDDSGVRFLRLDLQEAFHAILPGHSHVHQREVEVRFLTAPDRLLTRMDHLDHVTGEIEHLGEGLGEVAIVIHDQQPTHSSK